MIRVRISPDFALPGWRRERRDLEWRPGLRVLDLIPDGWPQDEVIALRAGRRVAPPDLLEDGDRVTVLRSPTGIDPLSLLLNIVISAALSYTASLLIGKPKITRDQRGRGETVYGFAGIRNNFVNGSSVPVVYGLHRVGGVVLSLFSKVENGQDSIYMLLAIGEGPIQEVGGYSTNQTNLTGGALPSGLLINGNPASGFRNVRVSLRLGTSNQTAIPDFSEAATTFLVNAELPLIACRLAQDSPIGQEFGVMREDAGLLTVGDTINLSFNTVREEEHSVTARNPTTQRVNWTGQANTRLHLTDDFVRKFELLTVAPGVETEAWDLNFLFPSGLFQINAQGSQESNYVHVQYRVREAGDPWPSWNISNQVQFEDNFIGAQRRTSRLEFGSKAEWEVQFRRITPRNFSEEQYSREVWLDTINLLNFDAFIYPFSALVGVKALASNQLNSGTPTVTVLLKGRKVGIWNGDAPATFTDTWSRNPAWIALDVLRSVRYGAGQFTDDDDSFDLDRFQAWADYCDEQVRDGSGTETEVSTASAVNDGKLYVQSTAGIVAGAVVTVNPETPTADTREVDSVGSDGGGPFLLLTVNMTYAHAAGEPIVLSHERHQCDLVFDSPTDIWQAAQQIAACGRASMVKVGTRIFPVWDRPQEPVQLFSAANIKAGTFKFQRRSLVKAPNTVEVSFLNADLDYDQDKVRKVTPEAEAELTPSIVEAVSLYGITRAAHAEREAVYLLRAALLRFLIVEFSVGLDALAAEPGDVILVEHPAVFLGRGCRIGAGSSSADVVLDHEVTIEAGRSYLIRVHHAATDTLETQVVAAAPGIYAAGASIGVAGTWATTPALGSVAVFGEAEYETGAFIIQSISSAQDLSRGIVAVNYDPEVYEDFPGVQTSSAPYGDGGAGSMANVPPRSQDAFPPAVTGLQIAERVREGGSGEVSVELHLSWEFTRLSGSDPIPTGVGRGTKFLVFARAANSGSSSSDDPADARPTPRWLLVASSTERFAVLQQGFDAGVEYEFAVVPTALGGGYEDPDSATPATYTPKGIAGGAVEPDPSAWSGPSLPETPTAVLAPGSELSALALHVRQGAGSRGVPLPTFEARLGGWHAGLPLAAGPGPLLMVPGVPPGGAYQIRVREVRQSGLVSADAALVANSRATPLTHTQKLNVVEAPGFSGTKTLMAVAAVPVGWPAQLEITGANLVGEYETGVKDAGAVGSSKPRATWLDLEVYHHDTAHDWNDATYAWNSRAAKCRTWEGDLYAADRATIALYLAYSDDGVSFSDWEEYRGVPAHHAKRYWKAKLVASRASTATQVRVANLGLIVTEQT